MAVTLDVTPVLFEDEALTQSLRTECPVNLFLHRVPVFVLMGALLLAAALLLRGSAYAAGSATLILHQEPFEVAYADLGGDGLGSGDLYTWIAPVTSEDGRSGTIVGEHLIVVAPPEGPLAEMRIGTSIIDLGNGDTLALGGLIPVPVGPITPGVEIANAIIGGTGMFAGAKGEIRSVRAVGGSWTHRLTYQNAGPVDPTRTVRMNLAMNQWSLTDLTGNGAIGAGDFRTFHNSGTTVGGQPFDSRGAQFVVRGSGEDGSLAVVMGYSMQIIDGHIEAAILAQQVTSEGRIAGTVTAAVIGGTGPFAGANGFWAVDRLNDGSIQARIEHFAPHADTVERTFVMRSALPQVQKSDRGEAGESLGDKFTFSLPFTGVDGQSGVAYGYGSNVAPASDGSPVRVVIGLISVQFADGSTILVADLHSEDTAVPKAADAAVTRPVLGGTGRYAGVSGELVTTLDGEGGLIHTFKLRGPAAVQPPVPGAPNTGGGTADRFDESGLLLGVGVVLVGGALALGTATARRRRS